MKDIWPETAQNQDNLEKVEEDQEEATTVEEKDIWDETAQTPEDQETMAMEEATRDSEEMKTEIKVGSRTITVMLEEMAGVRPTDIRLTLATNGVLKNPNLKIKEEVGVIKLRDNHHNNKKLLADGATRKSQTVAAKTGETKAALRTLTEEMVEAGAELFNVYKLEIKSKVSLIY